MRRDDIYLAVTVNTLDPLNLGRVRVRCPQVLGDAVSGWADPLDLPMTTPKVGDKVWVFFEGGDTRYPVYVPKDTQRVMEASRKMQEELGSISTSGIEDPQAAAAISRIIEVLLGSGDLEAQIMAQPKPNVYFGRM